MSKDEAVKLIVIGLIFIGLSSLLIPKSPVIAYSGITLFSISTILSAIRLFSSNSKWKNENIEKDFSEKFSDEGIFSFNETGFTVQTNAGIKLVDWSEVISIIGYKIDKYAYDNICADVFCENQLGFSLAEETPGWFQFLKHSKEALPILDKHWEIEISTPVFETNLTVVYDRENRSLKELEKIYYQTK